MQMSCTSELVPNHSCASACAVRITGWVPFCSFLLNLPGARGPHQGFGPTIGAEVCQARREASFVEAHPAWSRGADGDWERSRQSTAPMGASVGIEVRTHICFP